VPAILPDPLRSFFKGYSVSLLLFLLASFLSAGGQRKEAKEDRLL